MQVSNQSKDCPLKIFTVIAFSISPFFSNTNFEIKSSTLSIFPTDVANVSSYFIMCMIFIPNLDYSRALGHSCKVKSGHDRRLSD